VITIKKTTVRDSGSCGSCHMRATDPATGQWIHPDKVSWDIIIGKTPGSGTMVHICNECFADLKDKMDRILLGAVLGVLPLEEDPNA